MRNMIGVLGGMGPEATLYLFQQIIKLTDAGKDQDHVPLIIYNNPQIPDRSEAILKHGISPLPALQDGIRFLTNAGVSLILMPCVTAHYYYQQITFSLPIPVLNLIEETLNEALESKPLMNRFGLLATHGTVASQLFPKVFGPKGKTIITPDKSWQDQVMDSIYGSQGIKKGYKDIPRENLVKVTRHLQHKGAQAIIAGCTEVSLVLGADNMNVPYFDPLHIVVVQALKRMGYRLKAP